MDQIPGARFGSVGVAASVSEWTRGDSLTLTAIRMGNRVEGRMSGFIKCPELASAISPLRPTQTSTWVGFDQTGAMTTSHGARRALSS